MSTDQRLDPVGLNPTGRPQRSSAGRRRRKAKKQIAALRAGAAS